MMLFGLILTLAICLLLLFAITDYCIISYANYDGETFSEEIVVHFIHGSFPRKNCIDQRKRVGGLLGGHVEIEVDEWVYGFEFSDEKRIHIFPRKSRDAFNAKITMKAKSDWLIETKNDKITSIVIPIKERSKTALAKSYQKRFKELPFDYSFFGMRCTSTTYEDLAELGVFPRRNRFYYIINAFYPRQLRYKMISWAVHNNLKILKKNGIDCRVWE